ncbi:transposase [Dactylosporangium cerinum]
MPPVRLDLSAAIVDSSQLRALKGGSAPVRARSTGASWAASTTVITDAAGIPLAVTLTGGNRNDVTQLLPLIDAIPRVRGVRGRPRQRPRRIYADRGYDHDKYRRLVRARGIVPHIARRNTGHGSGLGKHRWYVERTIAWLHAFKKVAPAHRTPRRHPRSTDQPCLLSDLPTPAHSELISKRPNGQPYRIDTHRQSVRADQRP